MRKTFGFSGFLKSLIIIGIFVALAVGWTTTSSFRSLRIFSYPIETLQNDKTTQSSIAAKNSSVDEILDLDDLRASADIDWSMLYGSSEFERNRVSAAILEASLLYGVKADLLRAVIMAESVFNNKAVSKKGARGIMQLMPGTAQDVGVVNISDPRENILGGAAYLAVLLKEFDGDLRLAVAAYNAGPTAIHRSGRQIPTDILPYVNRVMSYYRLFGGSVQ